MGNVLISEKTIISLYIEAARFISSIANPIVYACCSKDYRKTVRKSLTRVRKGSDNSVAPDRSDIGPMSRTPAAPYTNETSLNILPLDRAKGEGHS